MHTHSRAHAHARVPSHKQTQDGYRDVSLSVLYTHPSGLAIVGEIQIHDATLFELKCRVRKSEKEG